MPTVEPLRWLAVILFSNLILCFCAKSSNSENFQISICLTAGLSMTIGPAVAFFALLIKDKRYMYLPISWFLMACSIFYGFGSFLFHFGSPVEIAFAEQVIDVNTADLIRVQLLNVSYMLLILAFYLVYSNCLFKWKALTINIEVAKRFNFNKLMYVIMLLTIYIKLFVALPYMMKLTDVAPPGMIVGIHYLSYGALVYLWYRVGQRKASVFWVSIFTIADCLFGLLGLFKFFMLLPIICIYLGLDFARHFSWKVWITLVCSGLVILSALQPINTYLRFKRASMPAITFGSAVEEMNNAIDLNGMSELAELKASGVQKDTLWYRLSFTSFQVYVMKRYEEGFRSNSYNYFQTIWVPRLLQPDKPLTDPGADFNFEVFGQTDNHTGPTLDGEAYYNWGWVGVLVLASVLSLVFISFLVPINMIFIDKKYEFILIIFLGIYVGVRIEDWAILLAPILFMGFLLFFGLVFVDKFRNGSTV